MARRLAFGMVVGAVVLLSTGCVAAPTPTALTLDSATAFAALGHSCGGIQQQVVATGFDPASGDPAGDVYVQTRCGGSGRGGGYQTTTYSAWIGVVWDFTGAVVSSVVLPGGPATIDPTLSVIDTQGDKVYNSLNATNVAAADCTVGNTTYCTYRAYFTVPVPTAPTGVGVTQAGDALSVTWTAPTFGGSVVTSSTVTATPTDGGTALTATVTGPATTAVVAGVQPATTYSITVISTDAGGTGPASAPASFTTGAATVVPSTPTGLVAAWNSGSSALQASWVAPTAGDSPIDDYQVQVAQHDPNGPPVAVDAGTATSAALTGFDSTLDYSVQVRAHNAAGWGPWTAAVVVPAAD